jgi:hypothetical protein
VKLVDQWRAIESRLPENWADARLQLTVADDGRCERAAAVLGAAGAGRSGKRIRFFAARRGAGVGPEAIRRMLRRLDDEGTTGELELLASGEPVIVPETHRSTLAASWDAALAALPSDWSDLHGEVELASSDYLEPAALRLSPLNPTSHGGLSLRFRAARRFGYGASATMVRRALERCDEAGIRGEVRVLRALSSTYPAATQGPVWYVGGRPI